MWIHILPTHTPNVKHLGCLQAPPPKIIMQRTVAHVTWWSCVKRPLKYISRDRMLIHDLWDLFYSSIHWFLKRMNPLGVRKKDSMRMDSCFFQKTWLQFRPNLSPNRPSTSFQSIYHPVSFTNSPPSCPKLWAFSRISILPSALSPPGISQHLCANELVLFKHASQALIVLIPLVRGWSLWSHLFNGGGSTGRIFTCEKHQMTCLKLNLTFFYKLLPLLTSLICQ